MDGFGRTDVQAIADTLAALGDGSLATVVGRGSDGSLHAVTVTMLDGRVVVVDPSAPAGSRVTGLADGLAGFSELGVAFHDGQQPVRATDARVAQPAELDGSGRRVFGEHELVGTRPTPKNSTPGQGAAPNPNARISQADFDRVLATPKGSRPAPDTYMSQSDIDAHLTPFRTSGAVRFTSRAATVKYGTIGPANGTFVISKAQLDDVLRRTAGNLSAVEQELGLERGTLSSGDTMIAYIEPRFLSSANLRIPDGNEPGANKYWIPGGFTSGGVPEATIDASKHLKYTLIRLGGAKP